MSQYLPDMEKPVGYILTHQVIEPGGQDMTRQRLLIGSP